MNIFNPDNFIKRVGKNLLISNYKERDIIIDPFSIDNVHRDKNYIIINTKRGTKWLNFRTADESTKAIRLLMDEIKDIVENNIPNLIDPSIKKYIDGNKSVISLDEYEVDKDIPINSGVDFTGILINEDFILGSYPIFILNDLVQIVSSGNKDYGPFFISGDKGLTIRDFSENTPKKGDRLYFNSSFGGLSNGIKIGDKIYIYTIK